MKENAQLPPLPTTPQLSKRYDRIWDQIVNRSDSQLVYTEIQWTSKKSGWITMNRKMYDSYLYWRREDPGNKYFKDFAQKDGLTAFILDPEGGVTLTADIPPRSTNENS